MSFYAACSQSSYDHSICAAKIHCSNDARSSCDHCSCERSSSCEPASSFCPKICGRCCGRLRRADVSCHRSYDLTIRTVSASYRLWNHLWTFWLQPLQSSVLGEFEYKA